MIRSAIFLLVALFILLAAPGILPVSAARADMSSERLDYMATPAGDGPGNACCHANMPYTPDCSSSSCSGASETLSLTPKSLPPGGALFFMATDMEQVGQAPAPHPPRL